MSSAINETTNNTAEQKDQEYVTYHFTIKGTVSLPVGVREELDFRGDEISSLLLENGNVLRILPRIEFEDMRKIETGEEAYWEAISEELSGLGIDYQFDDLTFERR